jgi:hypothetical protein
MSSRPLIIDPGRGVYAKEALAMDKWGSSSLAWSSISQSQERKDENVEEQQHPWEMLKREAEALASYRVLRYCRTNF